MRSSLFLVPLAIMLSAIPAQSGDDCTTPKIGSNAGWPGCPIADEDWFGMDIETLPDLNGDGIPELAIGAIFDDDVASNAGAVYVLFPNAAGDIQDYVQISSQHGMNETFKTNAFFGGSIASLGVFGGPEGTAATLAVGMTGDEVQAPNDGSIWIIFIDDEANVLDYHKIAGGTGGLNEVPGQLEEFGDSIVGLGDLDGDGPAATAMAVGMHQDTGLNPQDGSILVLFLDEDGFVTEEQKIGSLDGGLIGPLSDSGRFGASLTNLGDLDGPGGSEMTIAVGADVDSDGVSGAGAVWILFLNADGTVHDETKISLASGGFGGELLSNDRFGSSVYRLDDLDGDGSPELAVGAPLDDIGDGAGDNFGAIWILFLNSDGTVSDEIRFGELELGCDLEDADRFGIELAEWPDSDGDGYNELVVGALRHDEGGFDRGAAFVIGIERIILSCDSSKRISSTSQWPGSPLADGDKFGRGVAVLPDLNGDGTEELLVGAPGVDAPSSESGAAFLLFLDEETNVKSHVLIPDVSDQLYSELELGGAFGHAVAWLGSFRNTPDAVGTIAVGMAAAEVEGQTNAGALFLIDIDAEGAVLDYSRIDCRNLAESCDALDEFGYSITSLGDLDGEGSSVIAIAVGMHQDGEGGPDEGALWILFLDANGNVVAEQKINSVQGGFVGDLSNARFGGSVAALGDLDGPGTSSQTIAVGAYLAGVEQQGSVWMLELSGSGTVLDQWVVSEGLALPADGRFGAALDSTTDLDGDGVPELFVGAPNDPGNTPGAVHRGAVWILMLDESGSRKSYARLSEGAAGLGCELDEGGSFGVSVAALDDHDDDGKPELVAAAHMADDGGLDRGQVWIVDLNEFSFITSDVSLNPGLPTLGFVHVQPNPFNDRTSIELDLPAAGRVGMQIYDVGGRIVRTMPAQREEQGTLIVEWDGRDESGRLVRSGMYFVLIETEYGSHAERVALLR